MGGTMRLAARFEVVVISIIQIMKVATMGRRIADVNNASGRMLPGCDKGLLQATQNVLGVVPSAFSDKCVQE